MVKIDELVILGLLVIIIYLYFKNHYKKEHFEVFFSPYYPISSQITVRNNNYENEIEDFRLETLKKVLKKVIFDANDGNTNYIQFNYSNRPIIKNLLTEDKIKPLTEFLLQSINSNLPEGHNLKVVDLKDMFKNEIENEVKVNFKMFCEYKIKVLNNYKYDIQKNNSNNLIFEIEVLSKRKLDVEKLHLNTLKLIGIDGEYLPGSNHYKINNHFLFNNSLSNKIIENKENLNLKENNDINMTILPENSNEEVTITDINTEDAESFFDL